VSRAGIAFERFRTQDSEEWLMRTGAERAPAILFVPPLFEEMNRIRALIADIMRRLASMGHGCWLIDLRGTGESEHALRDTSWQDWRHDVASAASHVAERSGAPPLIASARGGCLIDDGAEARGWWRLAPVAGASLARDMVRAGLAGVEWAGYNPPDAMRSALEAASPVPVRPLRTAQLQSSAAPGEVTLPGPALWRRSEPASSPELAEAAATDLDRWAQACGAS
jgi:alpha-beta hydrolase superfamily lysophospholipase